MPKKLYVGNLPRSFSSTDLETLFANHGEVKSADVIMDRETGQSRGFGFVEMASQQGTQDAMQALDGSEVDGRRLVVNEARDRPPRGGRGGRPSGGRGKERRGGFGRRY